MWRRLCLFFDIPAPYRYMFSNKINLKGSNTLANFIGISLSNVPLLVRIKFTLLERYFFTFPTRTEGDFRCGSFLEFSFCFISFWRRDVFSVDPVWWFCLYSNKGRKITTLTFTSLPHCTQLCTQLDHDILRWSSDLVAFIVRKVLNSTGNKTLKQTNIQQHPTPKSSEKMALVSSQKVRLHGRLLASHDSQLPSWNKTQDPLIKLETFSLSTTLSFPDLHLESVFPVPHPTALDVSASHDCGPRSFFSCTLVKHTRFRLSLEVMEWSIRTMHKRSPVFSTLPQALTTPSSPTSSILFSIVRDGALFLMEGRRNGRFPISSKNCWIKNRACRGRGLGKMS